MDTQVYKHYETKALVVKILQLYFTWVSYGINSFHWKIVLDVVIRKP